MSRLRIFRGLDFFFILYLYAYLRHAFCWVADTHDRRCRTSVVGWQYTCASGTLLLWLGWALAAHCWLGWV